MTDNPVEVDFLSRLAPDVLHYTSEEFDLGGDLRHLGGVWRAGAHEATIFYAARILEVLTADALQLVGLPASTNVLSNLEALKQFNLIPATTRYWAHCLRRSGNSVRHIHQRVRPADAELSLAFVDRLLKWFFCDFRGRQPIPAITVDRGPIWKDACPELYATIESFDSPQFDPMAMARHVEEEESVLLWTPALPAVLAEILLDLGKQKEDAAKKILDRALAAFPADQRLQQLLGLFYSRTRQFDLALERLEGLADKFDDEETAGILGGIYKRLWQADEARTDCLAKSHRAYRRGWDRSKSSDAYPGINAATTALWLGRASESRETARKVRDLLDRRAKAIHARPDLVFDYWDRVSLAEAELLSGQLSAARSVYCEAFAQYSSQEGSLDSSRTQLKKILPHLGVSIGADEFLALPAPPTAMALTVGVTGHRTLPSDQWLAAQIQAGLEHVVRIRFGEQKPPLRLLSALADGADRLVARCVLAPLFGGSLSAVMPLEVKDYRQDFETPESLAEFQSLLNRAGEIIFPPSAERAQSARESVKQALSPQDERNAAYEWGGRYVVENCDVLVAVWDGAPAQGRGGTAEIVDAARKLSKPLLWVRSFAPFDWSLENPAPLARAR